MLHKLKTALQAEPRSTYALFSAIFNNRIVPVVRARDHAYLKGLREKDLKHFHLKKREGVAPSR